MLLESGARFGGYVLYVKDGRPVYEYAFSERERVSAGGRYGPLPPGRRTLRYDFKRTGTRQGTGTLLVDGRVVGTAAAAEDLADGRRDGRPPLRAGRPGPDLGRVRAPFPFTGTIHRVVVELGDDGVHDLAAEYQGALAEE